MYSIGNASEHQYTINFVQWIQKEMLVNISALYAINFVKWIQKQER
jgi:hypothetical protein